MRNKLMNKRVGVKGVLMLCTVYFSVLFQCFPNEHIHYLFYFFKEYLSDNPLNLGLGMGQRENSFPFTVVSQVWQQEMASLYSQHSFRPLTPSVRKKVSRQRPDALPVLLNYSSQQPPSFFSSSLPWIVLHFKPKTNFRISSSSYCLQQIFTSRTSYLSNLSYLQDRIT